MKAQMNSMHSLQHGEDFLPVWAVSVAMQCNVTKHRHKEDRVILSSSVYELYRDFLPACGAAIGCVGTEARVSFESETRIKKNIDDLFRPVPNDRPPTK
jgi:predicted HAD superfamily hydrolase